MISTYTNYGSEETFHGGLIAWANGGLFERGLCLSFYLNQQLKYTYWQKNNTVKLRDLKNPDFKNLLGFAS